MTNQQSTPKALRLADEWQRKMWREADRQNAAYDHYGMGNTAETVDPTKEGMLLRDYFAAQVVSAVFHGVFEDWRQNKAGIQEDWPTGIAVDAYRIADAMLKIREAT